MIMDPFLLLALLAASPADAVIADKEVAGATLRIEVQQPVTASKAAELIEWATATANNINLAYGRFPNPSPRIIIIPGSRGPWGSDSAVSYGRVTRRHGETVELFINPDRPIEEVYTDWTATHEFSHLMLPRLNRRHRWISEGFATYYQNILLSRAGRYTAELAWQRLTEGFARGQASRPELSPNEAASGGVRHARMKVYWSGAAIALLADIELRRQSEGEESLDSVLGQLQACCLPSSRNWSGQRLFKKLDSLIDTPVFMPLYRRYANKAGFPELGLLLQQLGVVAHDGGSITLQNNTLLAATREAISAVR